MDSIDIDNNGTPSTRLFDYDNAGNMIEDDKDGNITAIQYNDANRPASASSPGNTISYVHNSLGQRTVKSVNGIVRHFHYDEAGQLIAVTDGIGNTIEEFIYLGSMVVAHYYAANDEVYFAHNDHLNTVKALTDASGEIVWEVVSQTPFGKMVTDNDPDGDSQDVVFNLRFPEQYWGEETGTSYNYYRTYDPSLGRYVQSDPIGLEGGANTYAYVTNNPLYWVDPYGLHGQMSRHKGRQKQNPNNGGRSGIVGCIGMYCAQYLQGDSYATGSIGTGGLGAAFLLCQKPKPPQQCANPNASKNSSFSASGPSRIGLILGGQRNSDGTYCVSIGLMGAIPFGANGSTGPITID